MAMIECKIKRAGGSKIDIGGVEYHFKPSGTEADAPHVCEVADEDHVATFLAIREGYKLVGGSEKKANKAQSESDAKTDGAQDDAAGDDDAGMVLVSDNERIDLMDMGKAKLLKFAEAGGFKVDKTANAQTLRESIYKQAKA